jgi:hypothetical protein
MNTFQSTVSSPRNQRIAFWIGLAVLVAGITFLIVKLAGGSDPTPVSADKGFKPQLPAKNQPYTNAQGVRVTTYEQLDPAIKTTMRRFVVGAVAGHNYADSWNVLAPVFKKGYTEKKWATASAHPLVPFPVDRYEQSKFQLMLATTKEILVDIKLRPKPSAGLRVTRFRIGVVPAGGGKWLVDYWMPQYTPLVPSGQ